MAAAPTATRNRRRIMAKKNTAPQTPTLSTYTARGPDLKILGYVNAATEKEALKNARKLFDAKTVERRDQAPLTAQNRPATEATPTGKNAKSGQKAGSAEPAKRPEEAAPASGKKPKSGKKAPEEKPKKLSAIAA